MTLPTIFDIVIGTIYVYFFFSLLASGINEVWARITKRRAQLLEQSIAPLLGSVDLTTPDFGCRITWSRKRLNRSAIPDLVTNPSSLADAFRKHPLIQGLASDYCFPSYIPPAHFALVLIDLAIQPGAFTGSVQAIAQPLGTIMGTNVQLKPSEQRVVSALIAGETNIRTIQARIEKWFTDSGERISGAYKRATYRSLLVSSLLVSFGFGLDSIRLARHLYTDSALREIAVSTAKAATEKGGSLPPIPVGWSETDPTFVAGCLITALALTLGAPFWFDLLSRFVNLRHTGDPPSEKRSFVG